ncbi:hypothetical protein ACX0G7_10515 [Flavitalea antarctica]
MQYLSIFSVLLPLIAGIFLFSRIDTNSKWILALVAMAAVPQLSALMFDEKDVARIIFYNLYILCDAIILAFIFYRNSEITAVKSCIGILVSIQLAGVAWAYISIGIGQRFIYELVCLNSLLQVIWVLAFFYERYVGEKIENIEKDPMFWFCLGILLYAPTTYFLFVFYDLIKSSKEPNIRQLWDLHHFLNACMYALYTVGIGVNLFKTSNRRNASRLY